MKLRFVAEPGCEPTRETVGAAGLDLRTAEDLTLEVGEVKAAKTGLRVAIPEGYVGLIRGRSGLAFRRGVWSFEGTIDSDYRGEISLLLANFGQRLVAFERGERLAQLVIVPFAALLPVKEDLGETERGDKGFGSTGHR